MSILCGDWLVVRFFELILERVLEKQSVERGFGSEKLLHFGIASKEVERVECHCL